MRRSGQVNGDGFHRTHPSHHAFFGATHAGDAKPDRPYAGNFIEVVRGACSVSDRPLAGEFVQRPAFAMAFVAEGIGEERPAKFVSPETFPMVTDSRTTASRW